MRLAALVLGLPIAVCLPAQVCATDQDSFPSAISSREYPIKGSEKLYLRDVFAITECMAKNDSEEVRQLMSHKRGSILDALFLGTIAKRNSNCITRNTQMSSRALAIRGGLASALLREKYVTENPPNYADTPRVYGLQDPEELAVDQRVTELYLIIGECVFRRSPDGVLNFLNTKLFSSKSDAAYDALSPDFASCAPESVTSSIEPERMRGLLALAGYYVDLAYDTDEAGAG